MDEGVLKERPKRATPLRRVVGLRAARGQCFWKAYALALRQVGRDPRRKQAR
jgi:hypothetical protein